MTGSKENRGPQCLRVPDATAVNEFRSNLNLKHRGWKCGESARSTARSERHGGGAERPSEVTSDADQTPGKVGTIPGILGARGKEKLLVWTSLLPIDS